MKRHVSHTILTRVQVTLFTIVQSVILTRILGPEGRGLYAMLQAALALFILFLGLGYNSGITNYIANKRQDSKDVLGLAFWVWITGSVFLAAILVLFKYLPDIDVVFPSGYSNLFYQLYFFFSFTATAIQLSMAAALNGRQKFAFGNLAEVSTTILRTAVFVAFFLGLHFGHFNPSVQWIFAADLALVYVKTFVFAFAFFREFGLKFNIAWLAPRGCLELFGFSFGTYFSALIAFFYLRLDYWLIERQLGLSELGIYSVASGLAQYMTIIPVALTTLMVPLLADGGNKNSQSTLQYFSRLNMTATGILTSFLVALAYPLIRILYGKDFALAAPLLQFLAPSFFFLSIKFLFTNFNVTRGKFRINIVGEIIGLTVGLSLNLLLLPKIGVFGACWASLAANFASCAYIIFKIDSKETPPLKSMIFVHVADLKELFSATFNFRSKEQT